MFVGPKKSSWEQKRFREQKMLVGAKNVPLSGHFSLDGTKSKIAIVWDHDGMGMVGTLDINVLRTQKGFGLRLLMAEIWPFFRIWPLWDRKYFFRLFPTFSAFFDQFCSYLNTNHFQIVENHELRNYLNLTKNGWFLLLRSAEAIFCKTAICAGDFAKNDTCFRKYRWRGAF